MGKPWAQILFQNKFQSIDLKKDKENRLEIKTIE